MALQRRSGFDNEKYLREQSAAILERVARFHNKLYLEFGGKLLFDYHAARVLPGFDPNVKMRLLQKLKDKADIILCIYAGDIERRKMRADFGITYDVDAMKLIDDLKGWDLSIRAVVITRFDDQPAVRLFKNKLERRKIKVYTHRATKGYPTDVERIVSDEGYGANAYIETRNPLVVVTGPGPGSGKLATSLSQIYHDHRRGVRSGYAKFETFPIWNLAVSHPVNLAYEAATADLGDFNLVDPFHLQAHGETAVNYNRDVEIFPVLKKILEKIMGEDAVYRSPTDMGVNKAGFGIVDDAVVSEAARQEIVARHFRYSCEYAMGLTEKEAIERVERLMEGLSVKPEDRRVVEPARRASQEKRKMESDMVLCGAALELADGSIVTGKNSLLMHAASSLVLNAIKRLSGIPDKIHLLSPQVIEMIGRLKQDVLGAKTVSLDLEEVLIALSISAATNPSAQEAMGGLKELKGCDVHMTHIPTPGDEAGLRKLGVNLTSDTNFATSSLVSLR
jgi:uncharacterized protein (UPF0371 family)